MNPHRLLGIGVFLCAIAVLGIGFSGTAHSQPPDPVAHARAHLDAEAQGLGLDGGPADLSFIRSARGLGAYHVLFQQTRGGIPVTGAYVSVTLPDREGLGPIVFGSPVSPERIRPQTASVSMAQATQSALSSLEADSEPLRGEGSASLTYLRSGRDYRLAWQVVLPLSRPLGTWLVEVAADSGEVLSQTNLLRFDGGQVFDPNPAKTSAGSIPPPTDCDNGANETVLSGQYQTRTLLGIDGGQNKLKGEFVDLTAAGIVGAYKSAGVADELSRNYVYACNDDRFEETMVYYHVDAAQREMQALGFTGVSAIADHPLPAHAHYFSGCNAFYDPVSGGIHFGDSVGCTPATDTAEDADVIVHEYGHAIHDDQIPGYGFGSASDVEEAWAMGEGFGDFLPAALFGDPCLGEWVNFGGTACSGQPGLRTVDNDPAVYNYPEWLKTCRGIPPLPPAEPHCAGLIWGGALWDLVEALGGDQAARDLVLTLVLDGHFYLAPTASFAEAAAAIRQADTVIYGGAHVTTIDSVFSARGISATGPISDFPYAYLRIRHTYRGDLDIHLKVGSTASPVCEINVWEPNPSDATPDLVGYLNLTSACNSFLPPTQAQPWYLEVGDDAAQDVGTIEEFEIVLSGSQRCIATDVPVAIPDNDGFVYSVVDCTTVSQALNDGDSDTFADSVDNCPSDFNPDQTDTDSDGLGDACDPDDDDDLNVDADEIACGGDPLDPLVSPERLGNGIDDDGDTTIDEVQPPVAGFDCDGDGFDDDIEQALTWPPAVSAAEISCANTVDDDGDTVVNDGCPNAGDDGAGGGATSHQGRCADSIDGNNEDDDQWPADFNDDGRLNLIDVNSFAVPVLHFQQTPLADHARWNLAPGGATVNLVDVNALNLLSPPMFNGEKAFGNSMWGNFGRCPTD